MSDKIFIPQNKNAQDCVKNVMKYLSEKKLSQVSIHKLWHRRRFLNYIDFRLRITTGIAAVIMRQSLKFYSDI